MVRIPRYEAGSLRCMAFDCFYYQGIAEGATPGNAVGKRALRYSRQTGLKIERRQNGNAVLAREEGQQIHQLFLVEIERKDSRYFQQIEKRRCAGTISCQAVEETTVEPIERVSPISKVDHKHVGIDKDHERPRVCLIASRQSAYCGEVASNAASISVHASQLHISSFPEAAIAGEMTATLRPRLVTTMVAPPRTLARTAPVRFFNSLDVTDCIGVLL
jgi:hypothetical protein